MRRARAAGSSELLIGRGLRTTRGIAIATRSPVDWSWPAWIYTRSENFWGTPDGQMTKRYAHLSVNHKQAAVERIPVQLSKLPVAGGGLPKQSGELAEPG